MSMGYFFALSVLIHLGLAATLSFNGLACKPSSSLNTVPGTLPKIASQSQNGSFSVQLDESPIASLSHSLSSQKNKSRGSSKESLVNSVPHAAPLSNQAAGTPEGINSKDQIKIQALIEQHLEYPRRLQSAGVRGGVRLSIAINSSGAPHQIEVLHSDDERLTELVKDAILKTAPYPEVYFLQTMHLTFEFRLGQPL